MEAFAETRADASGEVLEKQRDVLRARLDPFALSDSIQRAIDRIDRVARRNPLPNPPLPSHTLLIIDPVSCSPLDARHQ